ncbi:MAG: NUDIX hydrolase [Thermodesulfobacteriota bacterium]
MYCDKSKEAAPPKPAATVVLLRGGENGFSVYLMRRAGKGGAFSGAFVFPGGLAEPGDGGDGGCLQSPSPEDFSAAAVLNEPELSAEEARALFFAAIRETWEEAGVLLASMPDGTPFAPAEEHSVRELCRLREEVASGSLSLSSLARELGVVLRPDWLCPFARWITPVTERRRFDARFFLARFPGGQMALPDHNELSEGLWVSPEEALSLSGQGRLLLYPPTYVTLFSLSRFPGPEHALAAARQSRVSPILPQAFCDEQGVGVLLPGDPDYTGPSPSPAPGLPWRMVLTEKGFSPRFGREGS